MLILLGTRITTGDVDTVICANNTLRRFYTATPTPPQTMRGRRPARGAAATRQAHQADAPWRAAAGAFSNHTVVAPRRPEPPGRPRVDGIIEGGNDDAAAPLLLEQPTRLLSDPPSAALASVALVRLFVIQPEHVKHIAPQCRRRPTFQQPLAIIAQYLPLLSRARSLSLSPPALYHITGDTPSRSTSSTVKVVVAREINHRIRVCCEAHTLISNLL